MSFQFTRDSEKYLSVVSTEVKSLQIYQIQRLAWK
uniref:Uncharacterized protein n=1 Tax=Nelumbo nucifera TaxID=4432 RepID=A0A822Y0E1_NELNU|nr:TPA_asm: hypothetical protein HUJ06_025989 [Nelumbo nucifera]